MNKVIFVGDRPSNKNINPNVAFIGTPSFVNLLQWINYIGICSFEMVNSYTEECIMKICEYRNEDFIQFVALGNEASKRLDKLGIVHFKLPHPSPRNRKLNNKEYIDFELKKCQNYLNT